MRQETLHSGGPDFGAWPSRNNRMAKHSPQGRTRAGGVDGWTNQKFGAQWLTDGVYLTFHSSWLQTF
jgi:hypothetical protein